MMSKINDGGPAFPQGPDSRDSTATGMTVRQLYAGQAMKALYSNPETVNMAAIVACRQKGEKFRSVMVKKAHEIADAMIAEGENPGQANELLGKLQKSLHQMLLLAKQQAGKFPSDFLRGQLVEAREALERVGKVVER